MTSKNPYINELELSSWIQTHIQNVKETSLSLIKRKLLAYNELIDLILEEKISALASSWKLGVSKAERSFYFRNNLSKKHKKFISEVFNSSKKWNSTSKGLIKKESIMKPGKSYALAEVFSDNIDKLLKTENSETTLIIPEIGKSNIILSTDHILRIEYNVFVETMKIRNFNKDKNVWEDDNLWKQVKSLSEFNKSMEENTISQEDMIEKVQTSKNNYSVIHHKEISKTIKAMSESYIAKHIQNSRENNNERNHFKYISEYPWENTKKVERLFEKWVEQKLLDHQIQEISHAKYDFLNRNNPNHIVSEWLFGSY